MATDLEEWSVLERDPVAFCEHVLGVSLWQRQVEIAESVRDVRETFVHTGNGVGKDFLASCLALWLFFKGYMVVTTATKREQLEDILWGELRTRYRLARVPIGGALMPSASHLEVEPKWFITGIVAKEQNAMQGFHAPRVAAIGDEAAGLAPWVQDALAGCCVGPEDRMLWIGNPTAGYDHWFIKQCSRGSAEGRRVIHVSSLETPNYVQRRNVVPGLFTREAEESAARRWGRESQIYAARVLGILPTGATTSLIGYHHLQAARDRALALPAGWRPMDSEPVRLGCDVARFGEDNTDVYAVQGPLAWHLETVSKWDGVAIAKRLAYHVKATGARSVAIDGGGLGAGPIDALRDLQRRGEAPEVEVFEVNFGSAPTRELESEVADRRTELYWRLRDWLWTRAAVDLPEEVCEELLAPSYTYTGKPQVIRLEPKSDLKRRLQRSPDKADALALAVSGHIGGSLGLALAGAQSQKRPAANSFDMNHPRHLQDDPDDAAPDPLMGLRGGPRRW